MEPSMPPEPLSQTDWQQTPPAVQTYLLNLHQRLAQLQQQIEKLQERSKRTSKTSDKPPSSDSPFQRPTGSQGKPAGKRGARQRTPGLRPQVASAHRVSGRLSCTLRLRSGRAAFDDAVSHPPDHGVAAYRDDRDALVLHQGRCTGCGKLLRARLPKAQQTGYGPRLTALIGELSTMHRLSRRGVAGFVSLGVGCANQSGGDSASHRPHLPGHCAARCGHCVLGS